MKKTKIAVIFSAFILFAVFGFVANVNASGTSLYVSPASLTKNVGDSFNVTVGVSASVEKVFAAEGTLNFNGLECKSITVASGLIAQLTPSCDNPHFLVGIPSGTTAGKTLITINVKAEKAGNASVTIGGVDVIGEGKSLSTASSGGSYVIKSTTVIEAEVKAVPSPEAETVKTPVTAEIKSEGQTTTQETETSAEEVLPPTSTVSVDEVTVNDQDTGRVMGNFEEKDNNWYNSYILWIIVIILIVIIIVILMKRKK